MATINVSTFSELKTAIEDTTSTDIIVTQDIVFSGGGARINTTKGDVTIDFGGHNITDNNSSTFTDTIYVQSGTTATITITAKNAIWNGRNYYGVIGVYDGNANTTIVLDNINYTGPQFVYNKNGTTKIADCIVKLSKNNSSTNSQEFCEANRLYISGNTQVTSETTSTAVIWFTNANSRLEVAENATFIVDAPSTYFLYTDSQPDILLNANSYTKINTLNGLFYSTGTTSHIANSFTMQDGASFISTQTASNSTPMFKCISSCTIGNNTTFHLYSPASGSASLMYFAKASNLVFNNPKSVILYNNGGNVFSFQTGTSASPNKIDITTQMLRLWNTAKTPLASAGTFDDVPTKEFFKYNYESDIVVNVTSTNTALISTQNNLVEDDTGYPMTTSTLNILTSKVISMGSLILTAEKVSDISTTISGMSESTSNMKAVYDSTTLTGTAEENGQYNLDILDKIPVGTKIEISANHNMLTKNISVISVGSVSITKIENLDYYSIGVPYNKNIINRINPNWSIEVTDTRTSGGQWELYVYIDQQLHSDTNTIDDCIVYNNNNLNTVITSTPLLVYTGDCDTPPKVTNITWSKENGILLYVDDKKLYSAGKYATQLLWTIKEIE